MIRHGKNQYPYTLFLSQNAYIKNIYVDYKYYLDLDASVSLIRNSGGVALLAHYFTIKNKITEPILDNLLHDKRLDGAETVFGLSLYNTPDETLIKENQELVTRLVNKNNALKGGGADIHNESDIVALYSNADYADSTGNLLQNILLKRKDLDLTWSSL